MSPTPASSGSVTKVVGTDWPYWIYSTFTLPGQVVYTYVLKNMITSPSFDPTISIYAISGLAWYLLGSMVATMLPGDGESRRYRR